MRSTANVGGPERVGSVVVGAGLAVLGFTRHTVGGSALVALGAAIIARGVTGWCPLYRSLGIATRRGPTGPIVRLDEAIDAVDEQSMDSFPASDAPSRRSIT